MTSQATLFDAPREEVRDLRDEANWQPGWNLDGVVVPQSRFSWCGRYAIFRTTAEPLQRPRYGAWRRHGQPEESRWSPPNIIGYFNSAAEARAACAAHADQEGQQR